MKAHRVAIVGYYGQQNTGDDALLAVSSWGSRQYLQSKEMYASAAELPNFKGAEFVKPIFSRRHIFRGENFLRQCYYLSRSDALVFGGGSVFTSSEDIKQKIRLLRLVGKGPHAAVGVSVGPFRDRTAERYCSQLLNRLTFVGARDQESEKIARAITSTPIVERTFDLAALLPKASGMIAEQMASSKNRRGIGLSMCNYERFVGGDTKKEEIRKGKMKQALKAIMSEINEELVLIDFNGHPRLGDFALNREIAEYAEAFCKVRHVRYSDDPLKVLQEIAGLRTLIGMRLHAAIFGYLSATPTLMLSYHQKCSEWASQSGMSEDSVFDSADFAVGELFNATLRAYSNEMLPPKLPLAEAERLATRNWIWTEQG